MPAPATPLDKLIDRAGSLYSLPAVAMQVVQMTGRDRVDTQALKETIETDPALTAKLLRVVNSSLFGLSSEVGNLTQAIALLGAQPLKLLVLGFSLPDKLFANLAAEALERYWTLSLTRAVAARDIATQWFAGRGAAKEVSGDDAFVAGLLRDIGALVLIQQLGEPYLQFLEKTSESHEAIPEARRLELERQSLGFDRAQLTAALLRKWKLPRGLIDAIECKNGSTQENLLGEVLQLAELVTQLVGEHRIAALPELLERGAESCGLDKPMVNELVASLQGQVDSLADAMRAPLEADRDYTQVLFEAHARMAILAESAIDPRAGLDDDELSEAVLAETRELRLTMRRFLSGDRAGLRTRTEGPHPPGPPGAGASPSDLAPAARRRLEDAAERLAVRCRIDHTELSLALVTVGDWDLEQIDRAQERRIEAALDDAKQALPTGRAARLTLGGPLLAVLLPGVDRRLAIRFCHDFAQQFAEQFAEGEINGEVSPVVSCGVAAVAVVPNKFAAATLIDGATRCLAAARTVAAGAVKSIEVY